MPQILFFNRIVLKPKFILIVALLGLARNFTCFAQTRLSPHEFWWACGHPLAALKVRKHLPSALVIYEQQRRLAQPDAFNSGGKLDAFRHIYTMAYLTAYVKPRKLRKLGVAHEKGNRRQFRKGRLEEGERPDSLACEMDLRNNELGFVIGKALKYAADTVLREAVLQAIAEGKAWLLKRNSQGQYVDCAGKVLNPASYRNVWYVPKCLVETSQ